MNTESLLWPSFLSLTASSVTEVSSYLLAEHLPLLLPLATYHSDSSSMSGEIGLLADYFYFN